MTLGKVTIINCSKHRQMLIKCFHGLVRSHSYSSLGTWSVLYSSQLYSWNTWSSTLTRCSSMRMVALISCWMIRLMKWMSMQTTSRSSSRWIHISSRPLAWSRGLIIPISKDQIRRILIISNRKLRNWRWGIRLGLVTTLLNWKSCFMLGRRKSLREEERIL